MVTMETESRCAMLRILRTEDLASYCYFPQPHKPSATEMIQLLNVTFNGTFKNCHALNLEWTV